MWKPSIQCNARMVDVHSKSIIAFSLGANLGDRPAALRHAVMRLKQLIPDLQCSSVYETEPVGFTEQPPFLNCACIGHTGESIELIHSLIQSIHAELHRQSRPRWHEREIDVDILIHGSQIIETDAITIPHPRMHQRAFVLKPLSDIAPNLVHPMFNQSMIELLKICPDESGIELYCDYEKLLQG